VFLALFVGIGGEAVIAVVLLPLFRDHVSSVTSYLIVKLLGIAVKVIAPVLMIHDGESWCKYLGRIRSRSIWLWAVGGILVTTGGFRFLWNLGFPRIAGEFNYMMQLSEGMLSPAMLLLLVQLFYYAAEGVLMVYIITKGSEAFRAWIPAARTWTAGMLGGLLLGLLWGLPHTFSQGSLAVGLMGLFLSILLGFLFGQTRSWLPPWLAWMGYLIL
jgi:hypothetical protein